MAQLSIVTVLVALLAPAPVDAAEPPASPEASEPIAAPAEPAPTSDAVDTAEPTPSGAEPGTPEASPAPAAAENPFAVPPPTAVAPTPAPIPPPPPRPIRWRLDLSIGGGGTVVRDPGVRAFAENRHVPEVGVSAVFDFRLAESRFFLGGGLGYQHVTLRDAAYGSQLTTRLFLDEPQLLGRVSFMAVEGVDAFARVGVGPSFASSRFQSEAFEDAEQRKVLPRVDARAGLRLYLPKAWLPRRQAARVTAGIELGLGYAWRGQLGLRPPRVTADDALPSSTAQWGALSLHGLSWGVGLFVRVM